MVGDDDEADHSVAFAIAGAVVLAFEDKDQIVIKLN
jgi:hypothetical protein